MAQEVGVAYVTLLPSGKGFGKSVEGQMDAALGTTEKKASGFFSRLGTGIKRVGIGVAALGGTVAAIALGGGISRALNIEDAQAKLKGLGHDTQSVETIMTNALAAVKGTAFGLDAAASTAAAAVASGIKPGQELERYLRLTADAATIAGVSMEEMGSIVNKVQAKGKAQMEDLNRLTERGIPILQMLANEYGVTAEEMSEMVSKGEVDAERFRKALEDNVGGAALASGDTTRGALANTMASLSRLGEVFAGPALGAAKLFFNEVTVIFDGLAERAKPLVAELNETFGSAFEFEGLGERVLGKFDEMTAAISSGPLPALLTALEPLIPALAEFGRLVGPELVDAITTIGEALAPVIPQLGEDLTNALIELLPALADLIVALVPVVPVIVEFVAALVPLIEAITPLISLIGELVTVSTTLSSFRDGETSISGFVTALSEAGGPIGGFILSLMLAGVGFIGFIQGVILGIATFISNIRNGFQTVSDTVRDTWTNITTSIENGINTAVTFVQELPGKILTAVSNAGSWLFETGKDIIRGLINGVQDMIGSAVAAVQEVGGEMLAGVKSFLGINSPSRVFRDEVGKMVGLGLLEGIEDRSINGQINGAVSHMVSIPETARANGMQDTFTLVDADGSILSRARVVADQAIDTYGMQQGAAMRYARAGG